MAEDPALFLVYFAPDATFDGGFPEFGEEAVRLADGLLLVRSRLTRSKLYHGVKRKLPADTPLLVAPLSGDPKFKGMAPGSTGWLRDGG